MVVVRAATLKDAQGITEVHCSDIRQWVRHGERASYGSLTIFERWAHGGPWMSVETCTIHINNLLLAGHLPLVAEIEGAIVAQAEIYFGREPKPYGYNANISVCYVHAAFQGKGIGRKLLQESVRISLSRGCESITVHNPAESALGFYKRCGFRLHRTYNEYVVKTSPYPKPYTHGPLPSFKDLEDKHLVVGRYQSQRECYDMLVWEQCPGAYALPGLRCRDITQNSFVPLNSGGEAFLALRQLFGTQRPRLYLYTPHAEKGLIERALGVVYSLHFPEATVLVDREQQELLGGCVVDQCLVGQKMLLFSP